MADSRKDARLNLRLRERDDALIRRAADHLGVTVSDFLTASALERAHEILADQHDVVLDDETWTQFTALLDEPPRPDPRLVELFARPRRIDR